MFESPYIKVNAHGIDIIKNYQVDTHIEYAAVHEITLQKGPIIINWILSFIVALVLWVTTLMWALTSILMFDLSSVPSSYVKGYISFRVLVPWLLFIGSTFWVYI